MVHSSRWCGIGCRRYMYTQWRERSSRLHWRVIEGDGGGVRKRSIKYAGMLRGR